VRVALGAVRRHQVLSGADTCCQAVLGAIRCYQLTVVDRRVVCTDTAAMRHLVRHVLLGTSSRQ
jgi:hypothetical protein